jgi:chromosome segregation ATPase
MQQHAYKSREESCVKEMTELRELSERLSGQCAGLRLKLEESDISGKSAREVCQALQGRVVILETESVQLKEKLREADRQAASLTATTREQDVALVALRKETKSCSDSREEALKHLQALEDYPIMTEGQLMKMAGQAEQLNALTSELEDKSSLITRLRSEAQANERNHAMRTAMLATCEAQVESLRSELTAKEVTVQEALGRMHVLQTRLASTEAKYEEKIRDAEEISLSSQTALQEQRQDLDKALSAAKLQWEESLEAAKKDFAKKSNLARTLLSERDDENKILSAKVQELQQEIFSGAPSERKIFELAQVQARRENLHGVHSETREIAFQRVQASLADRDLNLARLQQTHEELVKEIAELRRITKREVQVRGGQRACRARGGAAGAAGPAGAAGAAGVVPAPAAAPEEGGARDSDQGKIKPLEWLTDFLAAGTVTWLHCW